MPVVRHADPAAFLAVARRLAARDEAEAMMLEARVRGLMAQDGPRASRAYLATLSRRGALGAAFQLDAHPLSLGASDAAAAPAFADDLAGVRPALSGVYGMLDPCERFIDRWRVLTGRTPRLRFHMRHHVLDAVARVHLPPGAPRVAAAGDVRWLVDCQRAFVEEVGLPDSPTDWALRLERGVGRGLYWIWDDRGPKSFAGWSPAGATSARVAPVYTIRDGRGCGYATALVAALSQALLDTGVTRISLTTDLANPVSNAIYTRVGYRPTSDAYHFDLLEPARG